MSGMATGAAVATIGVIEAYFKDYLICCEHLGLDPTIDYCEGVVRTRATKLMSDFIFLDEKTKKRTEKRINWFLRNYKKLTGRWYNFPKRCLKLIKKDMLIIHKNTVLDEFELGNQLTQNNYDYFAQKETKYVFIALIIIGGMLLLATTAVMMIILL